MKTNTTLLLGALCVLGLPSIAYSQIWTDQTESEIRFRGKRLISPIVYRTLRADTIELKTILRQAPHESETAVAESASRLEIPLPDGTAEVFAIVQYDMMEPGLAGRYPEIRTFRGQSVHHPDRSIYLDWTLRGFHAMITGPDAVSVYLDPYSVGDVQYYVAYYKSDYPAPAEPFVCHVEAGPKLEFVSDDAPKVGDCVFRSYRLAMATTGEYSNYHGAFNSNQSGFVLSAVTTAVNRVNQVYARDIAVRMVLIANTDQVFYYVPATDPFTNNNVGMMLNQNQDNMTAVIGAAHYDIGHVFGTGGGGVAQLRSPCSSGKARAVTGLSNPVGDPFYIDFVAHEMGHQFGANHTFNNLCGGNRSDNTAKEPGSGSTIMSYSGVCAPNVQVASHDYLHAISQQEIAAFVTSAIGNSCATPVVSPNNPPTVTPDLNYNIPHSTPFVLTASASDPNGHPLRYCWEQWDHEIANMPPQSTNTSGPAFRTFPPSASPFRYFPRLQDWVNNVSPVWEVLPSVARSMNFRVTVRDNNGTYGCTTETNSTLTVSGSAGPFVVTQPNTAVTWEEGLTYTVAWNVAGTNAAPVSCTNVDILLSYDGGLTYPVVLLANTPNDGAHSVVVPGGTSATARVMVRCSNNVFFDISNTNFSITGALVPGYTMVATPEGQASCSANVVFSINTGSVGGYNAPVSLSISGLPAGLNHSFSSNPVLPGNNAMLTISNIPAAIPGTYPLQIQAMSASGNTTFPVILTIQSAPVPTALAIPAHLATDQSVRPTLSWNADINAASYEGQIASDIGFSNLVRSFSTTGTFYNTVGVLSGSTSYYWRVRGLSACAAGVWSTARIFTTGPCITFSSTDVPKFLDSVPNVVNSFLSISSPGAVVRDLNVVNLAGLHSWMADLTLQIISPDNTNVTLFSGICGSLPNFNLNFDQEAASASIPCPPTTGLTYRPSGNLNNMVGKNLSGTWTLRVLDPWDLDGGSLNSWGINVCLTGYLVAPLPVELVSFEAQAIEKSVWLRWATASERNNAGFEVERSDYNASSFKPITWVAGQGDATIENRYTHQDFNVLPGATYYYRLRQLDHDGAESYSEVRAVRMPGEAAKILIYPNPAGREFFVQIPQEATEESVWLECFDAQGRVVAKERCSGSKTRIDTGLWPRGLYTLRIAMPSFAGAWRVLVE